MDQSNYKGIYFQNKKTQNYYEFKAHFKYQELCDILNCLQKKLQLESLREETSFKLKNKIKSIMAKSKSKNIFNDKPKDSFISKILKNNKDSKKQAEIFTMNIKNQPKCLESIRKKSELNYHKSLRKKESECNITGKSVSLEKSAIEDFTSNKILNEKSRNFLNFNTDTIRENVNKNEDNSSFMSNLTIKNGRITSPKIEEDPKENSLVQTKNKIKYFNFHRNNKKDLKQDYQSVFKKKQIFNAVNFRDKASFLRKNILDIVKNKKDVSNKSSSIKMSSSNQEDSYNSFVSNKSINSFSLMKIKKSCFSTQNNSNLQF